MSIRATPARVPPGPHPYTASPWGHQPTRSQTQRRPLAPSLGGRAVMRLGNPFPPPLQRLRTLCSNTRRISPRRFRLPHDEAGRQSRRRIITTAKCLVLLNAVSDASFAHVGAFGLSPQFRFGLAPADPQAAAFPHLTYRHHHPVGGRLMRTAQLFLKDSS